ncbi:type III-B CRISPR-associated protein Cas10/Cmr2 [Pseudomonas sp. F1_0610]|uniref:type III-B CRISPR-associated protein Cas10/Cmr2 n=1 Tax=Pseudomonas sp. F1_0610 TaxID=3114284 RepID=UPI0039C49433
MDDKQYFQFTLGPVQSFVAQARRTRDFWAGSFILSWLSATAMVCIQKQGGTISFPKPDSNYLNWLTKTDLTAGALPPQQGGIPNRFKAGISAQVPAQFNPELVVLAVQTAWEALAKSVWDNDLAFLDNTITADIWQRQIKSFWEINWIISDDEASNALNQRKNWRNLVAPTEPGHKCMMMDGWQELSGITQTNLTKVNNYWNAIRENTQLKGIKTDLREGEHLCAMAFIKRRFSRYFSQVKVELPQIESSDSSNTIYGWQLPVAVPSVALLAVTTWLEQLILHGGIAQWEAFSQACSKIADYSEYQHISHNKFTIAISSLQEAAEKRAKEDGFKHFWAALDGQVYFPHMLANPNLFAPSDAPQVTRALAQLKASAGTNLTSEPSPYYAILLMDGDQLGKHMGDVSKQKVISAALNSFTNHAGDIVRQHNGFLVYAGGDDVLAILPLEGALDAARDLRENYIKCFKKSSMKYDCVVDSTLSGAIQFTHIRIPLTHVLSNAHELLDQVAKDKTGRDAIAVRVWKPSGQTLEWAMPWSKALDSNNNVQIAQLAKAFSTQNKAFSNKFFYRFEQLVERFTNPRHDVLKKLVLTEYYHSFDQKDANTEHIELLLEQCAVWQRTDVEQGFTINPHQPLNTDAAMLVRFLAQKGIERGAE